MSSEGMKGGITSKATANAMLAVARQHMEAGDGTAAAKLALEVYKQTRSDEAQALLEELFHGSSQEAQAASALEQETDSWLWWGLGAGAAVAFAVGLVSIFFSPSACVGLTPLLGFGSYAVTLWICCGIHRRHERYQPGVVVPVISELGISQPGTIVYQLGFAAVGLFLGLSMLWIEDLVGPLLVPAAKAAGPVASGEPLPDFHTAILCGYASAFGAALQGIFTLDMTPSLKVLLHFGGAICFMAGAMQHAQAIDVLYSQAIISAERAAESGAEPAAAASAGQVAGRFLNVGYVRLAHSFRHLAINGGLPVVGFVLPLGFQVYQAVAGTGLGAAAATTAAAAQEGGASDKAAGAARESNSGATGGEGGKKEAGSETPPAGQQKRPPAGDTAAQPAAADMGMETGVANMMGCMQWLIIFLFASYYATYFADLYAACTLTPSCATPKKSMDFVDELRLRGVLPQV